jgi:hypothetical protein
MVPCWILQIKCKRNGGESLNLILPPGWRPLRRQQGHAVSEASLSNARKSQQKDKGFISFECLVLNSWGVFKRVSGTALDKY